MNLHLDYIRAGSPLTAPETFRQMMLTANRSIRLRLAENPATPTDILLDLASDGEADVRAQVACNPSTPQFIVGVLADDESDDVRFFMAGDHQLPEQILLKLSRDNNPYVRAQAMKSQECVRMEAILQADGFSTQDGTTARLGDLLVASKILGRNAVENCACFAREVHMPLGRALVSYDLVHVELIIAALKMQSKIRLAQISFEDAVLQLHQHHQEIESHEQQPAAA